jgi:YD repeat-containing protein
LRCARALPGLGLGELSIPSEDGGEYYVFSPAGRHLRTVNALTGVTEAQFTYDTAGYLTVIHDVNNNAVTIERDAQEHPLAIVAPGGQRTTLTRASGSEFPTAISNPAGETVQFTYDASGLMQSRTDARLNTSTFQYDSYGLLTFDGDAAAGSTTLTRSGDDRDYTVTRQSAEGRQSTHHVTNTDDGGTVRVATDPAGLQSVTTSVADTEISTKPDGTTTTSRSTPDARFGMQASVASQSTTSFPSGRSLTATSNRSMTMAAPDSVVIATMTESATLNGHTFSTFFDAAQRTFTTTSAVGRTSTTVLDSKGQVASIAVPGITMATFAYDTRGRVTTIAQGARNASFGYDTRNRLTSVTDSLNRTVTYAYDDADRVTTQTLPDLRVISFRYDPNGNLAALTPPSRPTTLSPTARSTSRPATCHLRSHREARRSTATTRTAS